MNEKFLSGHPFCSESESHCEGEAFRNSDDDQRDRDNQDVGEGDTLLARSTTRQKGVVKKTETARGSTLTVRDLQYPTERRSES